VTDQSEDLRAPVILENECKIWFAGEAYHRKYMGFITGAYLSGQEVACQLLEELKQVE
jgi:monoamine oxidase